MLKLFILRIVVLLCASCSALLSQRQARLKSASLLCASGDAIIKLPIVQILENSQVSGEFLVGNDMQGSLVKFEAVLKQIGRASIASGAESYTTTVQNMYSDDMLQAELEKEGALVLKLYRDSCQRCVEFEPIYSAISAQIPVESNLRWLQANIADVPKYLSQTRQRLQGTAAGIDANTMDCSNCNSTGFVECGDCAGVGYSMKGQYAITCAVCCGAKKIRCGVCGGKCLYC
ncbi:hypothetical protein B484DRAFT_404290 [Ochromonadaceae sp. CCMP2298]|nr:hypothetical protein B484DRAFT_404290 [Ochromonadaceae sp. CCMP2298]